MNMKKTIAAIAAGAMAVSAMASSVSAIELADKVLSYNLVRTEKVETDGSVTLTAMFTGVAVNKDLVVGVKLPDGYGVNSITFTGKYETDDTNQILPYTRNSAVGSDNYDPNIEKGYMVINSTAAPAHLLSASAAKGITFTVTAVLSHKKGSQSDVNNELISAGKDLAIWYADISASDAGKTKVYPVISVEDWKKLPKDSDNNVADQKDDYELIDKNGATTPTESEAVYARTKGTASSVRKNTVDVVLGNTVSSAFTGKGTQKWQLPFQTTSDSSNQNIAYYLQNYNVRGEDNHYTNVLPTINDAIANYSTVTFTFTTATNGIKWAANKNYWTLYSTLNEATVNAGVGGTVEGVYADDGDKSYTQFTQHLYNGTGDIYGIQSGWAGFANGEAGNFYGGLWGDNNLFGGALVINENLTMRLSDVDIPHICNKNKICPEKDR